MLSLSYNDPVLSGRSGPSVYCAISVDHGTCFSVWDINLEASEIFVEGVTRGIRIDNIYFNLPYFDSLTDHNVN